MTRFLIRPRLVRSLALAVLVLFLAAPPGTASVLRQSGLDWPEAGAAAQPAVSGKLIVAFADTGQGEAEVAAELARRGLSLEEWLPGLGLARVSVRAGAEAAAMAALEQEPGIDYVTEERLSVEVADTPQDEYWPGQWGPAKVGLPAGRDLTWGDPSVVIAVVDTGVRYFHWDLRDQIWINPGESEIDPTTGKRTCNFGIAQNGQDDDDNGYADDCRGYNFDEGTNNPDDVYGHGTAVAGIAGAATNNPGHYTDGGVEGIAGMGAAARIMALRALNSSGTGSPFEIAQAISYAADEGAQVINLSLTLAVNYNPDDAETLCRATDYALSKGSLVVGASGNHSAGGVQPVSYPAACPGVLAVGASTQQDTRAAFSDAGSRLDIVAPGEGITTTLRTTNTSYGRWNTSGSGTSFAAPHAAGAAALVRSLRPDLRPDEVHALLRNTAYDVKPDGFDNATGWGRLDAAGAVTQSLDGLALEVTAEPPGTAVGNSTQVRVQVTGPGGIPAGFGARIRLAGALGLISPATVTADGAGVATATFTAGPTTGAGRVTAALGSLSAAVPIAISSGVPASIGVASDPPVLPTNGRSTLVASVLDEAGNLVAAPMDVTFAASLGTVNPAVAKTAGGRATTTFDAGATKGVAVIQASASGLSASLDLPVLGSGDPFTVTLTSSPAVAQAGGPEVALTATVVDSAGASVPDGTVVAFSTDLGALSVPSAATKAGKASVKLSPGTAVGAAHVQAKAGLVQGAATVTVVAGPVSQVVVSAEPTELVAIENQLATITAIAKDQYGNLAPDGVLIQFGTTLGELVATSAPVQEGRSQVQFIGGLAAGTAQITATAPGGAKGSTTVTVKPGAPAQMTFAGQPLELTVGGGASRLRATVKDTHGNLVASGVPVTLTTDLGQLRPAGGGAGGGDSLVVLTNAGIAEADLAPGTVAGVARVSASVSVDLQQSVQVTVRAARVAQLLISAHPMLALPGSRVDIAAQVSDQFGNPVANGINVTFGVTGGQLYQSVVPTADGVAYTWFTAPLTPGALQVNAIADGVSGAPITVRIVRPAYLPLIQR